MQMQRMMRLAPRTHILRYEDEHFSQCIEILKTFFCFEERYPGISEEGISFLYESYFKSTLYSSYKFVIVENSKVLGFLFATNEYIDEYSNYEITQKYMKYAGSGILGDVLIALDVKIEKDKMNELADQFNITYDSYINGFFMSSEFRSFGYGTKLINHYFEWMYQSELSTSVLWTDLDCSYNVYPKNGYTELSRFYHKYLSDKSSTENGIRYVKKIKKRTKVDKNLLNLEELFTACAKMLATDDNFSRRAYKIKLFGTTINVIDKENGATITTFNFGNKEIAEKISKKYIK